MYWWLGNVTYPASTPSRVSIGPPTKHHFNSYARDIDEFDLLYGRNSSGNTWSSPKIKSHVLISFSVRVTGVEDIVLYLNILVSISGLSTNITSGSTLHGSIWSSTPLEKIQCLKIWTSVPVQVITTLNVEYFMYSITICILHVVTPKWLGTLANSEYPDEIPHNAVFHQGIHVVCYIVTRQNRI